VDDRWQGSQTFTTTRCASHVTRALQGCVHGEMFPLVNDKAANTLKLFQARMALQPPF
jgi:hypothetical protein